MIFQLTEGLIQFPDPSYADEDGLLAIGGDLSTERLRLAYDHGIFPWFSEGEPILWYAPHERCVLFPEKIRISKSMQQVINKQLFTITSDQAFGQVIRHCADTPRKDQDGTWITTAMQQAYEELHRQGVAHSVEVWSGDELAGGLYGIVTGRVFCGESMFSHQANASKTALVALCRSGRFDLIDCQMPNPHLMSLGAEMISREDYQKILAANRTKRR